VKVFISWSGQRSLHVAKALREWLPDIVQYVEPWMSHEDIQAGAKWTPQINYQLSQTKFGIICLTPENQHKPWLAFEAGALAKTVDDAYVVPYLIDMDKSDVKGPLAQFQAVSLDEKGTFGLVQSINKVPDKDAVLPKERLEKLFKRLWPDLEEVFENLPDADAPIQKPRETDEILREVLELVRNISRRANDFPSRYDFFRITGADARRPPYGVTSRTLTQEEYEAILAMERAEETVEATLVAARDADEAAKADMERAGEAYEAMRDAVEADEQHEQD
jgi:hypothetical protein